MLNHRKMKLEPQRRFHIKSPIKLFLSITLPFFVQAIGSFVTNPALPTWYESLNKPAINPPNWLFAPVWTILYLLMGLSLYLVWSSETKSKLKTTGLFLFAIQLLLNSLWPIVFFDRLNMGLALLVILFLWTLILALISLFIKINKLAAYILLPYFAWVTYATFLNYEFWRLN